MYVCVAWDAALRVCSTSSSSRQPPALGLTTIRRSRAAPGGRGGGRWRQSLKNTTSLDGCPKATSSAPSRTASRPAATTTSAPPRESCLQRWVSLLPPLGSATSWSPRASLRTEDLFIQALLCFITKTSCSPNYRWWRSSRHTSQTRPRWSCETGGWPVKPLHCPTCLPARHK
jgi:hypothetical protein